MQLILLLFLTVLLNSAFAVSINPAQKEVQNLDVTIYPPSGTAPSQVCPSTISNISSPSVVQVGSSYYLQDLTPVSTSAFYRCNIGINVWPKESLAEAASRVYGFTTTKPQTCPKSFGLSPGYTCSISQESALPQPNTKICVDTSQFRSQTFQDPPKRFSCNNYYDFYGAFLADSSVNPWIQISYGNGNRQATVPTCASGLYLNLNLSGSSPVAYGFWFMQDFRFQKFSKTDTTCSGAVTEDSRAPVMCNRLMETVYVNIVPGKTNKILLSTVLPWNYTNTDPKCSVSTSNY